MTTLVINTKLVAAAAVFAAINDMRYYLNGVCFQTCSKGGVLAIATDGCQLFVGRDPDGVADKLPKDGLILTLRTELKKALKLKRNKIMAINTENNTITIKCDDIIMSSTFATEIIDGRFPEWQTILPSAELMPITVLQPSYLNSVATATKLLECNSVKWLSRGENHAGAFSFGKCTDNLQAFSVLMPLRDNDIPDQPEWL